MTWQKVFKALFAVVILLICSAAIAQSGFDDPRVMLQGFYWESSRHGDANFPQYGTRKWYEIVRDQSPAIRAARFDLVWLPPPSYAGDKSAGYNPKEYYRLDNSYGSWSQHRVMLETLLQQGIEPIADIVINHRDGSISWDYIKEHPGCDLRAYFKNPDWGLWAITKYDSVFSKDDSPLKNTPMDQRGAAEEIPSEYARHGGTTYEYDSFSDIDHTNPQVRKDILRYLFQLKSAGYRGWRYDVVHGYHAKRLALYNLRSNPTFSVGEYEWEQGQYPAQRGWCWFSAANPAATGADHLKTSSSTFDFMTLWTLLNNKSNYQALYGVGTGGLGLVGDNTDGLPWKQRAVTFISNHDVCYRTKEDGTPDGREHERDPFYNGWEVEQAYAYILTHPGVPTVFWKHYFDWGSSLQERIKAMINARKVAGVHSGSNIHLQSNARDRNVYAAMIEGTGGRELYVRIGGNDDAWTPRDSGYVDCVEYARGDGWKIWVKVPGASEVLEAPLKTALPIPTYKTPAEIEISDSMIDM